MYPYIDTFLIFFYRISDIPIFGYLFGTFCLCLLCVLIGRGTYALAAGWNRKWIGAHRREMVRLHNLSLKALVFKDKPAYQACNKEANDAFGKYFFAQMAMGMSTLWPAPFALAWMETRFSKVTFLFPGIERPFGYLTTFILLFILANITFSVIRRQVPAPGAASENENEPAETMMALDDL
ncbi:MAG: hypothetical protein SWC96_00860 [Thermodesulfobacteriota bacterium]|nr:hypothetical protein [Thermodesulfobacteriota bacterium]